MQSIQQRREVIHRLGVPGYQPLFPPLSNPVAHYDTTNMVDPVLDNAPLYKPLMADGSLRGNHEQFPPGATPKQTARVQAGKARKAIELPASHQMGPHHVPLRRPMNTVVGENSVAFAAIQLPAPSTIVCG